jgi:hypothetical protein
MPQINSSNTSKASSLVTNTVVATGAAASAVYLGSQKLSEGKNPLGSVPFNLSVGTAIQYTCKAVGDFRNLTKSSGEESTDLEKASSNR